MKTSKRYLVKTQFGSFRVSVVRVETVSIRGDEISYDWSIRHADSPLMTISRSRRGQKSEARAKKAAMATLRRQGYEIESVTVEEIVREIPR